MRRGGGGGKAAGGGQRVGGAAPHTPRWEATASQTHHWGFWGGTCPPPKAPDGGSGRAAPSRRGWRGRRPRALLPLRHIFTALCAVLVSLPLQAQAVWDGPALPLRRVTLFSSGVGFFERGGVVEAAAEVTLAFDPAAVNDALKSLSVSDPASAFPVVRYASAEALERTLRDLRVDLSDNPPLARILASLRGAEIEAAAPTPIAGRVLGVENRETVDGRGVRGSEPWLTLFTAQGIRAVALRDVASIGFKDPAIAADLGRALDLLAANRDEDVRVLTLSLPGTGRREVAVSYVIPAPVWKVSYRLDLSGAAPRLQGWAVVDNDSGTDWEDVELSLVTGRPVSFIQNLYPPYRVARPVLPLAIAGAAEARAYESGTRGDGSAGGAAGQVYYGLAESPAEGSVEYEPSDMAKAAPRPLPEPAPASPVVNGVLSARSSAAPATAGAAAGAAGAAAGDQFEFAFTRPVSIPGRESAMLPLVSAPVKAVKTLVLSGERAAAGPVNPAISVELTNVTGMKLPAGPVTVYDAGTYAGDALIGFVPEGETRIISYGEDLSVRGSLSRSAVTTPQTILGVAVSKGVMTLTRRRIHERVYAVRNASAEARRLIIEHPITAGAELVEPSAYAEKTASLYRFAMELPANREIAFTVREEQPVEGRYALGRFTLDTFLGYAADAGLPEAARSALSRAAALLRAVDDAAAAEAALEARRERLAADQDRARRNLEAAGSGSPQGQEYLRRMAALDEAIDSLDGDLEAASRAALEAREAFDRFLGEIEI